MDMLPLKQKSSIPPLTYFQESLKKEGLSYDIS